MSLFDKHIIHKPENFTDASGVGLIPDYSGVDVKSCGIRFPGLPSGLWEDLWNAVEWIESFGPNYWELHWRPREAGIENRFYVCPQWGPFPLLSPGTKWGRLLAIGESISPIVPQCGLIDDMCHTTNHSEWRHEHIFQQPLLLSPHFDNSYLEIVEMLTWKEWSWSFDVIVFQYFDAGWAGKWLSRSKFEKTEERMAAFSRGCHFPQNARGPASTSRLSHPPPLCTTDRIEKPTAHCTQCSCRIMLVNMLVFWSPWKGWVLSRPGVKI